MSAYPPNLPTQAPYPPHQTPHRGVLILVFGILGLVMCFAFGIAAWVMGNRDLVEIRSGRMDRSGEGLTQAGRICGIIATIIGCVGAALGLVYIIIVFVVIGAAAATGGRP